MTEAFPFDCIEIGSDHSVVLLKERHDAPHLNVVCDPGVNAAIRR
jgi:hypothetical protein